MPRETKAQKEARLAAEAEAEAEAALLNGGAAGNDEVDALLQQAAAGEDDADDLDEEFDLSELRDAEEAGDFEAFADTVVIECTKLESKTSERTGDRYLRLTWVVQEGVHEKAHIWDTIMLQGKGTGMGKRKLNQLGVDLSGLKRSDLVGLVANATTKIKRDKSGEYDDKTEIKKYLGRVDASAALPE
jgi:hypothetical protein